MKEEHTVVVTFIGICTHCENVPLVRPANAVANAPEEPGRYRRTVLVNASHGLRRGRQAVAPHDAHVQIRREFILLEHVPDIPGLERIRDERTDVVTWKMKGVRLYIAHAFGKLTETCSFRCIPSLTRAAGILSLQLDERVVLEGRAAAVFDLFAGELDAYRLDHPKSAIRGKFTATVSGQPILIIEELWRPDHFFALPLQAAEIDGTCCPPQVLLLNTGVKERDQQLDFLLHYHATTWSPRVHDAPPYPEEVTGVRVNTDEELRCLGQGAFDGLNLGCSNTNYP